MNRPTITEYTIPEPTVPWGAYALGAVVPLGLFALLLAAGHAFSQVTDNEVQAWLNAILIEASAIVESLALARSRTRRDYAIAGAATAFSLGVSAIYNYVQAQTVGLRKGVTEPWQLWPLALGPLVALAFLSFNLGRLLREWEDARAKWLTNRQAWFDDATAQWEQAERQAQAEQEAANRAAAEREAQAQREAAERQAQAEQEAANRAAAEREAQAQREAAERQAQAERDAAEREAKRTAALERARLRAEAQRNASGTTTEIPPTNGTATGTTAKRFGSKSEFLAFMQSANGEAPKSAEEVKGLGVAHTTAYRWWKDWLAHKATIAEPN